GPRSVLRLFCEACPNDPCGSISDSKSVRIQATLLADNKGCARNGNVVLTAIDEERAFRWSAKEAAGEFLNYRLHAMFYWDPVIHQSEAGHEWEQKLRRNWRISAGKIMQRTRAEHERLLSEFTSLLAGIETTLGSTGMAIHRLDDDELFVLVQRGMNPSDT